jgi:hypothetical protein
MRTATLGSLILVLRECGALRIHRTLPVPLAIWVNFNACFIYLAPEVMCRQNHNIQVDYFAVGVMAFECMFGRVQLSEFLKNSIETLCREV